MLLEAAQQSVRVEDPALGHSAAAGALRLLREGTGQRAAAGRTAGLFSLASCCEAHLRII